MRIVSLAFAFVLLLGCQLCLAAADPAADAAAAEVAATEAAAAEAEMYTPEPGAIEFMEIPSTDLATSQAFYGSIFGWAFEAMDENFVMFSGPGETMGAFTTDASVAEGGIVLYITVEDIDATLASVNAAGGSTVNEKMQLPEDWGFIGHFADPSGNVVGLWSAQ